MDAAPTRPTLAALNAATEEAFTDAMSPYFEGASGFLARLAAGRPFHDERDLFARAAAIAQDLPEAARIELLDAHPRIGAPSGSMSAASRREQSHGRPRDPAGATAAATAELDRLNAAYEERFGFRFVVFVAGRTRAEMVPLMEARLRGNRETEMRTGLTDVVAVARDRWRNGS